MGRFLVVLGLLGGSFGGLGGSWAALGRLLGCLEAVLDRSWAALSRLELLGSFLAQQGRLDTLTWARFGSPKGSQDDPKSNYMYHMLI